MDDAVGPHLPHRLPRRRLLGAVLAGATIGGGLGGGLIGCGQQPDGDAPGPADRSPGAAATYADLVSGQPFYIAHRGGGSDWPEMTAFAYQQAAKVPGLKAMEISVCLSRDGVLVCSHDPNLLRVTGFPAVIADNDWATLSKLRVSAENTVDPSQPSRPLARIEDVVPAFIDDFVLFVEPKTSSADLPLMKLMAGLNQPQRVVWKQPINSRRFALARRNGFHTWGYVLNEPGHLGANLTRYAADPDIDLLGVQLTRSEQFISTVARAAADNAKSTISWPVQSPDDRRRLLRLGCEGMMAGDILAMFRHPV